MPGFIASSVETAEAEWASFQASLEAGERRRREAAWARWATTQPVEAVGLEDDYGDLCDEDEDDE